MITYCTCDNEYQDNKHGKKLRVQNPTNAPDGRTYRCTVCGKENKK